MLSTKTRFRKLIQLVLFLGVISIGGLKAQPGDPGGDPDNPVPITGIELLVAAGAWLGFRKIKSMNRK